MGDLSICSYNLHGLNNGMSFLTELCNVNDIIFVQEHWLQPSQLHLLNNMNDNFVFYGKSSMERNVCSGLLDLLAESGCYGTKNLLHLLSVMTVILMVARVVTVILECSDLKAVIFGVYFPCDDHSRLYIHSLTQLLS